MRNVKVKLELDANQDGTEVTLRAKELTPEIEHIYHLLQQNSKHPDQLAGYLDDKAYYLNMNDILFFETDSKQVMAHTTKQAFLVKYKLYELEKLLVGQFMRVSKSTILNLDQIYSLTRSISNCQVEFYGSYKSVYVSRHYYRELRQRLEERRLSK